MISEGSCPPQSTRRSNIRRGSRARRPCPKIVHGLSDARKVKEKIHRTMQRQVTLIMQAAVRPRTTIQPFIARSGNRCAKHERDSGPESQTMFFRGFSFRLRTATDSRHAPRSANRDWRRWHERTPVSSANVRSCRNGHDAGVNERSNALFLLDRDAGRADVELDALRLLAVLIELIAEHRDHDHVPRATLLHVQPCDSWNCLKLRSRRLKVMPARPNIRMNEFARIVR